MFTQSDFDGTRVYKAVVTNQIGPSIGEPTSIMYEAQSIMSQDSIRFGPGLPYRRLSEGAHVIAAAPGDICEIQIIGGEKRLLVTETIPFQECPEP